MCSIRSCWLGRCWAWQQFAVCTAARTTTATAWHTSGGYITLFLECWCLWLLGCSFLPASSPMIHALPIHITSRTGPTSTPYHLPVTKQAKSFNPASLKMISLSLPPSRTVPSSTNSPLFGKSMILPCLPLPSTVWSAPLRTPLHTMLPLPTLFSSLMLMIHSSPNKPSPKPTCSPMQGHLEPLKPAI